MRSSSPTSRARSAALGIHGGAATLVYGGGSAAAAPDEARVRVEALTDRSFACPCRRFGCFTDDAGKFHLHAYHFPGDPVLIWVWDDAQKVPISREVSRTAAEAYFGLSWCGRRGVDAGPTRRRMSCLSVALEKAVERVGFAAFPAGDAAGTFAAGAGGRPRRARKSLAAALDDGKPELAAVAAAALGQVTDGSLPASDRRIHPLCRRVGVAQPPGSIRRGAVAGAAQPAAAVRRVERVVPTLARFVARQGTALRRRDRWQHEPRRSVGRLPRDARLRPDGRDDGRPGIPARCRDGRRRADLRRSPLDRRRLAAARYADQPAQRRADCLGIPTYVYGPQFLDASCTTCRSASRASS